MDISSVNSVTNIDYIPEQLHSPTTFPMLLKVIKEEMQIAKECAALYPQIESYEDFLAIQIELESYLDARGYGTHFSKIIKTIDINSYVTYEETDIGAETLVSSYLLSLFVNPGIFHGERFINEILAQKPNLDLPVMHNDPTSITCRESLNEIREFFLDALTKDLPKEVEDVEFIKAAISRTEFILNH